MEFQDVIASNFINRVNDDLYIPIYQRKYEWDEGQMLRFFDSFLKGYDLKSFKLADIDDHPHKDQLLCYDFINSYVSNQDAPTDELNCRNENKLNKPDEYNSSSFFVIDGQQRINTLFIGLTGTLWKLKPGQKANKSSSWYPTKLAINLLRDLDEYGRYDLQFRQEKNMGYKDDKYWYPIENILKTNDLEDEKNRILNQIERNAALSKNRWTVRDNMDRLDEVFVSSKRLSYNIVKPKSPRESHEVFIRTNDGGTNIGKTNEKLTKMAPVWDETINEIPREEFTALFDTINTKFTKQIIKYDNLIKLFFVCLDNASWTEAKRYNDYKTTAEVWNQGIFEETLIHWANLVKNSHIHINRYTTPSVWASILLTYRLKRSNETSVTDSKDDIINLLQLIELSPLRRTRAISAVTNITNLQPIQYNEIEDHFSGTSYSLYPEKEALKENLHTWSFKIGNNKAYILKSFLQQHNNQPNYIINPEHKNDDTYYTFANIYFDKSKAEHLIKIADKRDHNEILHKNTNRLIDQIHNKIETIITN